MMDLPLIPTLGPFGSNELVTALNAFIPKLEERWAPFVIVVTSLVLISGVTSLIRSEIARRAHQNCGSNWILL